MIEEGRYLIFMLTLNYLLNDLHKVMCGGNISFAGIQLKSRIQLPMTKAPISIAFLTIETGTLN